MTRGKILIFRDNGISGKLAKNTPGLAAALEAIGPGSHGAEDYTA